MSAEVCGNGILTPSMIEAARQFAVNEGHSMTYITVSPKACYMMQRIRAKFPNFIATCEAEIWWKAYSVGLLEDE